MMDDSDEERLQQYGAMITGNDESHKSGFLRLSQSREQDEFADAWITSSDGRSFHVTKFVLAAVSPFFKALFGNSLQADGDTNGLSVMMTGEIMEIVIRYAYSGTLDGVTPANLEHVLQAVDFLNLLGGIDWCSNYMMQSMDGNNCLDYLRITNKYYLAEVAEAAKTMLLLDFRDLRQELLNSLTFQEMDLLLKDDRLNVPREEQTYSAIVKWIEADPAGRRTHFGDLLKHVRFGNSAVRFVETDILAKNKWVQESPELQEYLKYVNHVLRDIQQDPVPIKFDVVKHPFLRPRIPRDIIFTFGGWSASSATNAIETYDCRVNKWYKMEGVDTLQRAYHGMVFFDGLIYVIGGFDGRTHFSSVVAFDPVSKTFLEKGNMGQARCYVSCAVVDDHIYACGGYNGQVRMGSCERYDKKRNQWSPIASMSQPRSDASAAALGGLLYVVGGFDGTDVLPSVEVYHPQLDKWVSVQQMFSPRSGVQALSQNELIYVFGGNDGLRRQTSAEVYDPLREVWVKLPPMRIPRSNFACISLEGLIYIVGGFNGQTTINDVECYDPHKNMWYDMWPMNMTRSALTACVASRLPNGKEFTWLRRELKQPAAYKKRVSSSKRG